jgi:hypothetical protein
MPRLSTGLTNKLLDTGSAKDIFANCVIDIYSGVQPTLPDNVPNGTLLGTVTKASGAYTPETRSAGSMTLTGGAAGSVNTVTVNSVDILGGAVAFITDLATTAAAVVAQINRNPKNPLFVASSVGAVITLTAVNGLGTLTNTWAVSATLTTITASYSAMTGGVDAVNGLRFDSASAGVLSKIGSETWSCNFVADGTAGWFRIRESGDAGTALSTAACRIDGSIATSGGDMTLGSLTCVAGAPFVLPNATITLPQQ